MKALLLCSVTREAFQCVSFKKERKNKLKKKVLLDLAQKEHLSCFPQSEMI